MFAGLSGGEIVVVIVSIIFSLSLHEAMHGFTAHWLGDSTAAEHGRLTLNPLRHIDMMTTVLLPVILILTTGVPFFAAKPVPFNPLRVKYEEFGAALIGIAGPLTNLVLAALGGLSIRLWGPQFSGSVLNDVALFILVNLGFFVFNMIPLPPLDGSRLLYAFAPEPLQNFMRAIENMGFMIILVFVLVGFQFISPVIINIESALFHILTGVQQL
jgi:Zn-dependent protease